jgi:hypothetical protein
VDGKAGAMLRFKLSSVSFPGAFGISSKARWLPPSGLPLYERISSTSSQSACSDEINPFNVSLSPIAFGEID